MAGRIVAILVAVLLWAWPCAAPAAADATVYSFAAAPQFDRRKSFEVWKPIVDAIAARTGIELRLSFTLSVAEFEHQVAAGRYDFVYTNPYHVLRERDHQGYIPLVRDASPLQGILVVPRDSPVTSPAQLDGKTLAVPSANALGASLLLQAELARKFGVHMSLRDVKTHTSVYLHVGNGLVDAGGGVRKILDEQEAEVRDRVRIIHTTGEMPSHPVAAHPRVPAPVREKVRQAFLELQATPEGAAMLARVPLHRLVPTSMADYLPMAEWGLDAYWRNEGPPP